MSNSLLAVEESIPKEPSTLQGIHWVVALHGLLS